MTRLLILLKVLNESNPECHIIVIKNKKKSRMIRYRKKPSILSLGEQSKNIGKVRQRSEIQNYPYSLESKSINH